MKINCENLEKILKIHCKNFEKFCYNCVIYQKHLIKQYLNEIILLKLILKIKKILKILLHKFEKILKIHHENLEKILQLC